MSDLRKTTGYKVGAFVTRRALMGAGMVLGALAATGGRARAAPGPFEFASIDGGVLPLSAWAGRPVLVVNTASRCGFTPQYEALQTLHERYGPRGAVVLAVPSDDFRQELSSEEAVKEFCEVNFGLTLPMSEITRVRGRNAHPFYRWMAEAHGFSPRWNFNKVLLDGAGQPVGTFPSSTSPLSPEIVGPIEAMLAD